MTVTAATPDDGRGYPFKRPVRPREVTPMMQETHTTQEGFELHRPLLLPDARSFADVLDYLGEWDVPPGGESPHEPRYIPAETPDASSWQRQAWTRHPDGRNRIGPYCRIELSQLDGRHHRGIAVRATDAVLEAVEPRIVTPDDDLSFQVIGHERTGRALVTLEHGYIIGGHWLAYIDPATIPADPRDA